MEILANLLQYTIFFNIITYGQTNTNHKTYILNGKIVTDLKEWTPNDDLKTIEAVNNYHNRYTDHAHGYQIHYPNHMWVDVSLSAVKTIIFDENRQIEIYYDDFNDTIHNSSSYINYTNLFKNNRMDHDIEIDQYIKINGYRTHLLKWSREKLPLVENDKNHYVKAVVIKNHLEVYIIFLKSSEPILDYMEILNSFRPIKKTGAAGIYAIYENINKYWNEETRHLFISMFVESDLLKWGIFEPSAPDNMDYIQYLEEQMEYPFYFLLRYNHLDFDFPMEAMKNAQAHNKVVLFTMQTLDESMLNHSVTYEILQGKYDDYFIQMARDIKSFGHPVLFRLNNEMNGDWCLYSSFYSSNDTQLFKALWHHIYQLFQTEGVDNALWVWNPHDLSFPDFKWNHYLNYYPGNGYVDIIGLTGYNTGNYYPGEIWRGFREIYEPLYEEYDRLFQQPFMITEFGSNSVGGNKIQWIHEMFDHIHTYPRIKVAVWWNGIYWDANQNPARIYRLDETEEMLEVFRQRLKEYLP